MSPCECRVPVHIVLWLADIHHLVGVQLEHALHLQVTVAVLRLVRGPLGHSFLLQLLPSSLALSYPSQIPVGKNRFATMSNTDWQQEIKKKKHLFITPHIERVHHTYREAYNFTWTSFIGIPQYALCSFKAWGMWSVTIHMEISKSVNSIVKFERTVPLNS